LSILLLEKLIPIVVELGKESPGFYYSVYKGLPIIHIVKQVNPGF
jgi:hypothetical protein